jgi:hypothetical protein
MASSMSAVSPLAPTAPITRCSWSRTSTPPGMGNTRPSARSARAPKNCGSDLARPARLRVPNPRRAHPRLCRPRCPAASTQSRPPSLTPDTAARVEGCDGHGGQVVRPRIRDRMIHDGGRLSEREHKRTSFVRTPLPNTLPANCAPRARRSSLSQNPHDRHVPSAARPNTREDSDPCNCVQ